MIHITVVGAGPSGAAAAIAAGLEGAHATLYDKSSFPRHKVCGEFLSPGIAPALEALGLYDRMQQFAPAPIRRFELHVGKAVKRARLPEPAFGLSRWAFDTLLQSRARELGARLERGTAPAEARPLVQAAGRTASGRKGTRLFGFKAHFRGPASDAVELYFFDGCYVGVNAVEEGRTNVCGLGPESVLSRFGFQPEALLASYAPLRDRMTPLNRAMNWLHVGPLLFRNQFRQPPAEGVYPAGDALSFVDPFTGTGLLSALISGRLAGQAAARRADVDRYIHLCEDVLQGAYRVSAVIRSTIELGLAEHVLPWVPGSLLFRLTRPKVLI